MQVCLALSACGLLVMLLAVRHSKYSHSKYSLLVMLLAVLRLNLTNFLSTYHLPPDLPTSLPP